MRGPENPPEWPPVSRPRDAPPSSRTGLQNCSGIGGILPRPPTCPLLLIYIRVTGTQLTVCSSQWRVISGTVPPSIWSSMKLSRMKERGGDLWSCNITVSAGSMNLLQREGSDVRRDSTSDLVISSRRFQPRFRPAYTLRPSTQIRSRRWYHWGRHNTATCLSKIFQLSADIHWLRWHYLGSGLVIAHCSMENHRYSRVYCFGGRRGNRRCHPK